MKTPTTFVGGERTRLLRRTAIATVLCALLAVVLAPGALAQQRAVTGVPAVRLLVQTKQYAKAEEFAYNLLWKDIEQPEVLGLLAQAVDAQKRPDDAAVWYTLMLRATAESELPKAQGAKYKAAGDRRLAVLNTQWDKGKAAHEKTAPARKFESPEKVDDGWMTQATAGLKSLHGLYAWKLIGGRQNLPADWVHNAKGAMHRSGLKLVDELDGRSGVAFTCFNPDHQPTAKRPLTNRIALGNVGGVRFLRIGTKGYNFPYGLTVTAGDRKLLSQTINANQWSDLIVDLGEAPSKGEQVVLELYRPEGQRHFEGAWFDYIDFFKN